MTDDFSSRRATLSRLRRRSRLRMRQQQRRQATLSRHSQRRSLPTTSSRQVPHSRQGRVRRSQSLNHLPAPHKIQPDRYLERRQDSAATSLTPLGSNLSPELYQPRHVSVSLIRSRLLIVWGLLLCGLLGLTGNLIRLQVFQAGDLQQKAQEQHGISLQPFTPRRAIVDRHDNVLAIDRQAYILYAHPILFKEQTPEYKEVVARLLAPILAQEVGNIVKQLNLRDSGILLKRTVSQEEAERIRSLYIDGLDLNPYQERFYPQGNLFAHIVGYINFERKGQVGVEKSQAHLLSRSAPKLNLLRTAHGALMPDGVPEEFNYHEHLNLKLTVDSRLQRYVRNLLQTELSRLTAKRGVVILMDVNTGAIRAMVTEPSYEPDGSYSEDDIPLMVNSAISHLYEPGSTFKSINVAIALESGRLHVNDIMHDSGRITMGTWSIANHDYEQEGARGDLTISDVLKHSSNVGMIRMMQKLDREQYYDWLINLGLGESTGIDLPFEAPALLKPREQFVLSAVESATVAFGQGIAITPLQLLQLQAAIANGGKLVTPRVIDGLFDYDGQKHWTPEQPDPIQVFSETNSQLVLEMMEEVVLEGTGKLAQVPDYRIAGKTGTAQKVGDGGIYDEKAKVTSFVSLFPVNDPQFALLVLIDEPQGKDTYGGTVAAPIAQQIIKHIISLENIPPAKPPAGE